MTTPIEEERPESAMLGILLDDAKALLERDIDQQRARIMALFADPYQDIVLSTLVAALCRGTLRSVEPRR